MIELALDDAPDNATDPDLDPFTLGSIELIIATTEPQREVWLGDQLSPEASLAYNEAVMLRMRGALDTDALAAAVNRLVERHQSLRSTLSSDGLQMVIGEAGLHNLVEHDLSRLDAAQQERTLTEARSLAVRTPFALETGPLFRTALYSVSPLDHVLVLSAHHVVCDGWSWGVISEDLGQLYAEQLGIGPAPDPAARYADFGAWELAEAASPAMQEQFDYWLGRFAGSSMPVLELPLDHARHAVRTFSSRRIDHPLDPQLVTALRKLGSGAGTSLFATMLGAFAATLHRLTAQDDLVIGIAAAGQLASDMPTLVGHCVNLLPLRMSIDAEAPFESLMRDSGNLLLDAFEHQTLTYGTLLKKLPLQRDPSRLPLVSVLFNVDPDVSTNRQHFAGLDIELGSIPRDYENFELFLNVTPVASGMRIEAQYNADLFDDQTVRRWLGMYECVLRAVASDPGQAVGKINLLSPAEADALVALQPQPTPLAPGSLFHSGFLQQAATNPERWALKFGNQRLTYGELDRQSSQLAHALRARGIGRGQYVGLCVEREPLMIVAQLAVLKAGAAYVPLDPDFPQARLDYYAKDTALALMLTTSTVRAAPRNWRSDMTGRVLELDVDTSWKTLPDTPLAQDDQSPQDDDLAYVIYTSGSTGRPKGVCILHRPAAGLMQSMQREPGLDPDDRMAAVTTQSFDMAVTEIMLPLSVGAEVVLVPREAAMDGEQMRMLLESEHITVMQATPVLWRLLVDAGWKGTPGFRAWFGAESMAVDLAFQLMDRCAELWNLYGPTETTVWSTFWLMQRDVIMSLGVAVGRPLDNTSIWILDSRQQLCPIGVPGEICVAGISLAQGYMNQPELTAERFAHVSINGCNTRIYRTGDRGRWRNDGLVEHMGRFDFQVKVRGYRIELGEIEARCIEVSGVTRCVVITREDHPGDVQLVAYLAVAPGASIDRIALRDHLRERLPKYMLPHFVITLPALPTLPNGKIDRKSLPSPHAVEGQGAREDATDKANRRAPRDDNERRVLEAMERVLSLPGISIDDDFFSLGGHSLLAARLTTLLSREFAITLPMRTLFEHPTVESLTRSIEKIHGAGNVAVRAPMLHRPDRRSAVLTPPQERIRFMEELYPGRSVYNAPSASRLTGPLDVEKFTATLREIARRQPAMRTRIGPDPDTGLPVQLIDDSVDIELPLIDLSSIPADQREDQLRDRMQQLADSPIDIHRAPMFHVALFRMAEQDHAFVFVPHHLVWDGWSFDILHTEMSTIYAAMLRGEPHGLPELTATLGDFGEWYAQWTHGPAFQEQMKFWKSRFATAPKPRSPQTDMARRAGMSGQGELQWITLDTSVTERLRDIARDLGVTLNMLTFGVYVLMMSRVIGSDAVIIATPVRGREAPETEPVMGFFNNVLLMALEVDVAWSLRDFMQYVKRELLLVMNHQQVMFEQLVAEPEFTGRTKGSGLYQAMYSFQDVRERPARLGPLEDRQIHVMQRGATDDLGLWLMDTPGGLYGAMVYNADVYLRETGVQLRERYTELLGKVAEAPHATLQVLASPENSRSAAYLRRLAALPQASEAATSQVDEAVLPAIQPGRALETLLLPEQARLAQIWASIIGIDVNEIRASDNFFDLGGDSLLAMGAVQQSEKAIGYRVEPQRYVFESLAQLATPVPVNGSANRLPEVSVQRQGLFKRVLGHLGLKGE